mgnify:CR=1 FL=1
MKKKKQIHIALVVPVPSKLQGICFAHAWSLDCFGTNLSIIGITHSGWKKYPHFLKKKLYMVC